LVSGMKSQTRTVPMTFHPASVARVSERRKSAGNSPRVAKIEKASNSEANKGSKTYTIRKLLEA